MLGFQKLDSCRSTPLIVLFPRHAIKLSWTQVRMHKFWTPKQGILISKWALSGCGVSWSRADRVSSLSQRAPLKASAARAAFTAKAQAGSGYKVFVRWIKNIGFPHSSQLNDGWSLPPRLDRREGSQAGDGSHQIVIKVSDKCSTSSPKQSVEFVSPPPLENSCLLRSYLDFEIKI